jgi:hypothetical protein
MEANVSGGAKLTVEQIESHLSSKTDHDPVFRAELLSDPRRTIEVEFHIRIRPAYDVQVTFDGANRPHVKIERREDSSELSDADLESVAGGTVWPLPPDMFPD